MPCVTVHMLVAREVAGEWERSPDRAPVDPHRRGVLRAFYHGALAPDMGFAPGVDRFVSDLAHHLATGDLARALLRRSRNPVERAFAYGWLTHVLSDAELHPLVGRAMGERVLGDRAVRMNTHDALESHVSIEVGLDAVVLARTPATPTPPFRPLRPRHLEPLSQALEATFGLRWGATDLHEVHRRTARLFSLWPLGLRLLLRGAPGLAGQGGGAGHGVLRRALAILAGRTDSGSAASGYLRPSAPPAWLLDTVLERVRTFPERFRLVLQEGLATLGNPSLETGGVAGPGQGHPVADRIAARLARRHGLAGDRVPAALRPGGAGAAA